MDILSLQEAVSVSVSLALLLKGFGTVSLCFGLEALLLRAAVISSWCLNTRLQLFGALFVGRLPSSALLSAQLEAGSSFVV